MKKESLLSSMPKLILAVVLIVCIGVVMGLMGYALTKKQTRIEAPEVKTPDKIVKNKTADWQTYRNEEFGFEIKYPNIYKIGVSPQLNEYQKSQGITYLIYLKHSDINASISVRFTNINFNLQDIKQRFAPTGNENFPEQIKAGQNTFYFYGSGGGGVSYPDNYFYDLNGKILIIDFDGPYISDKTPSDEIKQLESRILSSFKFIEKDDTSDWQTYRNEEFGFEIKYPEEWNIQEDLSGAVGAVFLADVYNNKNNKILDIIIAEKSKGSKIEEVGGTNTKKEMFKINGINIMKEYQDILFIRATIEAENSYILFEISAEEKVEQTISKDDLEILDQILSSFKFIEKEIKETVNLEKCFKIENKSDRADCYKEVAEKTQDLSICDKLVGDFSNLDFMKQQCYVEIAIIKKDEIICEGLWEIYSRRCYHDVAIIKKDSEICAKIKKSKNLHIGKKDDCYVDVAIIKQDPEICGAVQNDTYKSWCSKIIQKQKLTPEEVVCGFLHDRIFRKVYLDESDSVTGEYKQKIAEIKKTGINYDPVTCTQANPDNGIIIEKATIQNDTASLCAVMEYSGSGSHRLIIDLVIANDQWKIDDIDCPL